MNSVEVPGKIFVLGEYHVIEGGKAILAPIRPGYIFEAGGTSTANPDSPYGRYLQKLLPGNRKHCSLRSSGLGPGFGTSTAELIAGSFIQEGPDLNPTQILEWYQTEFPRNSGADLRVQTEAIRSEKSGMFYLFSERGHLHAFVPQAQVLSRIQVFRTPSIEKLPTHIDLMNSRPKLDHTLLENLVDECINGLRGGYEEGLLSLTRYAEVLSAFGYETNHSKRMRLAFLSNSSVLSVKGCGAGLHDSFVVVMKEGSGETDLEKLRFQAEKLGLESLGSLGAMVW